MALLLIQHPEDATRHRMRTCLEEDGHWTLGATTLDSAHGRILTHRPDVAIITADGDPATTRGIIESFKKMNVGKKLPVVLLWNEALSDHPSETLASTHADALVSLVDLSPTDLCNSVRTLLESPPGRAGVRRFLRYGHLELDRDTRSARLGSAMAVDIPEKHFSLLWFLAKRAMDSRDLCPREVILTRLWKNKVRDREVDVTISRLRSRLPFLAPYIESVPGKGYRFLLPGLSPRKPLK